MKKLLLLFFLTNLSIMTMQGQSMLTIRQVYDFSINDEIQSTTHNIPPNATRIKIIGKHFSLNNDTVFYLRHFDNYSTIPDMTTTPPHLVYTYSIGNDSVFYTNLDSAINSTYGNFVIDSCNSFHDTLYYTSQFCSSQVYELTACTGCCFEGYFTNNIYGKGLGLVFSHYSHAAEGVDDISEMFYYKKDTIVCGTPDTSTALSVNEYKINNNILLYPNPFFIRTTLQKDNFFHNATLKVDNCFGQTVAQIKNLNGQTVTFNRDNLASGLYFFWLTEENTIYTGKFVITNN